MYEYYIIYDMNIILYKIWIIYYIRYEYYKYKIWKLGLYCDQRWYILDRNITYVIYTFMLCLILYTFINKGSGNHE